MQAWYPPPPKQFWTTGMIVLVVVVILILGCATVAVIGVFFFAGTFQPPDGTSGEKSYSATLQVDDWWSTTEYGGQVPDALYFFIVNATVTNTGNSTFTLDRFDWTLRDLNGLFIDWPDDDFYSDVTVIVGASRQVQLVFDLTQYASPAKVRMDLPDGRDVTANL